MILVSQRSRLPMTATSNSMSEKELAKPHRLLDLVRQSIRLKHYSLRTVKTYIHWIRRFIFFHGKRHPLEMGAAEVTAFLNHLVRSRDVAASTQNQALAAMLFLYWEGLDIQLASLDRIECAKRPACVPSALRVQEVGTLSNVLRQAGLKRQG